MLTIGDFKKLLELSLVNLLNIHQADQCGLTSSREDRFLYFEDVFVIIIVVIVVSTTRTHNRLRSSRNTKTRSAVGRRDIGDRYGRL